MKKLLSSLLFPVLLVACMGVSVVYAQGTVTPDSPWGAGDQIQIQPGGKNNSSPYAYTPTSGSSSSGSTYCSNVPVAPFKNLTEIIKYATCFMTQSIVPLIFSVALVVFLIGVVRFIQATGSAEREEGRQFMIWGVVALAVMFGVWGLVKILGATFGVQHVVPQLPINVK
jgi:hypothetical protein